MHEKNHEQETARSGQAGRSAFELDRLRKMARYWINHNEEHARSYMLWASRAREAGQEEPGDILEEIAGEMAEQNRRLKRIVELIGEAGTEGDEPLE